MRSTISSSFILLFLIVIVIIIVIANSGFDPLGFKPTDAKEFANVQAKELSNGRLAMLAVAGMCVQELVNGKGILENLGL